MSFLFHTLVLQSNNIALSTQAWTILACVLLCSLDLFSCCLTLNHALPALSFLCFRFSVFPIQHPSILVLSPNMSPKIIFSSLLLLFFSSNSSIVSFILGTAVCISFSSPRRVVSSANRDEVKWWLRTSELNFSHSFPGSLLPGTQCHGIPTSLLPSPAISPLLLSAVSITTWWYMLKRIGEVGHLSLSPPCGYHGSLQPSFPFTLYWVVSWRSISALRKFPPSPALFSTCPTDKVCLPLDTIWPPSAVPLFPLLFLVVVSSFSCNPPHLPGYAWLPALCLPWIFQS